MVWNFNNEIPTTENCTEVIAEGNFLAKRKERWLK